MAVYGRHLNRSICVALSNTEEHGIVSGDAYLTGSTDTGHILKDSASSQIWACFVIISFVVT